MYGLEDLLKAFTTSPKIGRVILATNMAESSITLPDVT